MKITARILDIFEKVVIFSLIAMMVIVIILSTVDLGQTIFVDIVNPPDILINTNELLDIFGAFMLILIGVELLETIKAYLSEHVIHVDIVLNVALIAVARKIIIIDVKEYSALSLVAIAAIVITLAGAYYLQKIARK
jgi:uncharacterized membrane protein (DUF373 family)